MTQSKKTLSQRLNSQTPDFWGKVRNVCIVLSASIGAGYAAASEIIDVPEEWGKVVAIAIGILTVLAGYSQQKDSAEE